MSGHSKWSTIKRAKAKNDTANAKVFTKILRELAVAVKEGGSDPNSNTKLRNIILKARSNNMPSDNIQRTIKKASVELGNINYSEITYEGYGPAGSAVMVEALTDNKNRTASDVRHLFDKFGGSLGQTGSVNYMFNRVVEIIVLNGTGLSDDAMMMHALEAGAEDVVIADVFYKIITSVENFETVKTYLENNKIEMEDADVVYMASNYIDLPEDKINSFNKLIDALEDNDDVQDVYHNVNLPDVEEDEE